MLEFLTSPENIFFSVSLVVVLIIALLEGVGAIFGAGISNIINCFFSQSNFSSGIEAPDLESPSAFGRLLSWLRVGQIPILVLIVIFFISFGISGLIMQRILLNTFGFMLPAIVASILVLFISLPIVRLLGSALNKIIPKDETSAVSKDVFIGRIATITLGESKINSPAQGKVKDDFGKSHYIMIEPDNDKDIFYQGNEVLLTRQDKFKFYAIPNNNKIMSE